MSGNDYNVRDSESTSDSSRSQGAAWFARDDPVEDFKADDRFGHRAYTDVLARAVLEATPPFTIGVFGRWGVGKTTITKTFLRNAIDERANGGVAYAYFDAWKYEGDSLRRQFLQDVARQLKADGKLKRTYNPDRELQDLVTDVTEATERGLRFSWVRLVSALVRFVIGFAIAFVAIRVFERFDVFETAQDDFVISIFAGVIAAGVGELGRVIAVGEQAVTRRSLDAPDLFEQKFRELMNNVKPERVVIVVDNLDRCSPERVVEVLSTVKTFLEPAGATRQPIFVIPCDEDAIRRHLRKHGEIDQSDADEYLRKFFNAAVRISPILSEEIREHAASEVDRLWIGGELNDVQRHELTQVITVAFRENPRRVKQFLNTLTTKLLVLRAREESGAIQPKISDNVPFLAKLTVIEEEWPDFYRVVQDDVRALDQLSQHAIGLPGELGEHIQGFAEDERLRAFLRGTRLTVSANVRAFTRLKLSPIEREITDYWEFRTALVDGRLEDVRARMASMPADDLEPYRQAALEIVKEEVNNGYFDASLNVVDAFTRVDGLAVEPAAGGVIEQLYSVEQLRTRLPSLAPYETFTLLALADSEAAHRLIGEYARLLEQESLAPTVTDEQLPRWQSEVGRGLMAARARLRPRDVQELRRLANGPLSGNVDLLAQLADVSDGPRDFLGDQALTATIGRLTLEDFEMHEDGRIVETAPVLVWLRSREVAGDAVATVFVQKAGELLSQVPGEPEAPGRDGLVEVLYASRGVLGQAEGSTADALAVQLQNHYPHIPHERRARVISVLFALHPAVTPGQESNVRNLVLQFAAEPLPPVEAFVASEAAEDGLERWPQPLREAFLTRLRERFWGSADADEQARIAGLFVKNADEWGWDEVSNLLTQAVDAGNVAAAATGIEAERSVIRKQSPETLRGVINHVLERLPNLPLSDQAAAFDQVLRLSEDLEDEHRTVIRDQLIALMCNEDPAAQSHGLAMMEKAVGADVLRKRQRRHLVEQIVVWLLGRVDRIDESSRPYFDRVIADIDLVDESTVDHLIQILKGLLPKSPGLRSLAAEYLVALPLRSEHEVVDELIHWARQETDAGLRQVLIRRAYEIARRDRRTKAWKVMEAYVDELAGGDDADKALAEEIRMTEEERASTE